MANSFYIQGDYATDSVTVSSNADTYTISSPYDTNGYQWVQIGSDPIQIDPYTPQPQGLGPYTQPWEQPPPPTQGPIPAFDPETLAKLQKIMEQGTVEAAPLVEPAEISPVEPRAKRFIKLSPQ